jgi:hypothetical protein
MLDIMKVLRTSLGTTVRTLLVQLAGMGAEGADDDAEGFDDAEVWHPAGYLARPALTAKTEALVQRDGDEAIVLAIGDKSLGVLSDLDVGEVRITGVSAANLVAAIRILAVGEIVLTSKSGTKIRFNAAEATATKPVAHEGSATSGHFHEPGTFVAGPYAVTGTSASKSDTIATGAGSANVLVPDT